MAICVPVVVDPLANLGPTEPADVGLAHSTPAQATRIQMEEENSACNVQQPCLIKAPTALSVPLAMQQPHMAGPKTSRTATRTILTPRERGGKGEGTPQHARH